MISDQSEFERYVGRATIATLWFLPVIVLIALGTATEIRLPGLYMDAINPDYIAVRTFHPSLHRVVWVLPGNLIFDRFPLLPQIYHGALPYWIGLPLYGIIGTDIIGVRITHGVLAFTVLLALWLFLRSYGVRPWIATALAAALAIDPAFLGLFRTQFYILAQPIALVFFSLILMSGGRRRVFFSGLLAGLAAYGYFVYLFYALALLLILLVKRQSDSRLKDTAIWIAGALVGFSPAILGYGLYIYTEGGFLAAFEATRRLAETLEVTRSGLGVVDRFFYTVLCIKYAIFGVGVRAMIFQKGLFDLYSSAKIVTLMLIPLGLFAASEISGTPGRGLRIVVVLLLVPFVYGLMFGDRLWAHHFGMVLSILCAGAGFALEWVLSARFYRLDRSRFWPLAKFSGVTAALAILIWANVINAAASAKMLRETGGIGLTSDAINHFAEASLTSPPAYYFFPDWGLMMPFAMLTGGAFPYHPNFDPKFAISLLCSGQDVIVATIGKGGAERLASFATLLPPAPQLTSFAQRDGTPIIWLGRWKATRDACTP